jgi:hypothetical protein
MTGCGCARGRGRAAERLLSTKACREAEVETLLNVVGGRVG